MQDPVLSGAKSEHEGRGYVQSDDVVNAGFIQGQESFVRVLVVYDEPLPLDNYEGIDITRLTQELRPKSPYDLNVMHITVDGKPIDDPNRSSSDVQRCTDVALDNANIQFRFDNLESRPRLSVAAHPVAVSVSDVEGVPGPVVRFRCTPTIRPSSSVPKSESSRRISHCRPRRSKSSRSTKRASRNGCRRKDSRGVVREVKYLLRAYDPKGNFDETVRGRCCYTVIRRPRKVVTSVAAGTRAARRVR